MTDREPAIRLRGLTKRFGQSVVAVRDINLDIHDGEFFALLGPSGCGKTTLLRMIAGFEVPSEGSITIDGEDMTATPPNKRPVNMVFQSYAVFPHMTVEQNVGYGLRVTGVPREKVKKTVGEALALVRLEHLARRKPSELSGGERQRVALARALVKRPKVLLLDEPLSALDAKLRQAMRSELVSLQGSVGITFLIVTHDQDEALSMADRIAVMEQGVARQIGSPDEIYEFPNCRFVADFIGKMNLFTARVRGTQDGRLIVEANNLGAISMPRQQGVEGEIGVAIRPEKVKLDGAEPSSQCVRARGRVVEVAYYGGESHVTLDIGNARVTANIQNDSRVTRPRIRVGDELWTSWNADDMLVLMD